MELDGKEWTIVGTLIGWGISLLGLGRAYGDLSSRVSTLENLGKPVFDPVCAERRSSMERENKLQFAHGAEQFAEVKRMISENDRASKDRHNEMMKILLEMNKN